MSAGWQRVPANTIFAKQTALALRTRKINLGQGFPDDLAPAAVRDAARHAIDDGLNQYPPGLGNPNLRRAISQHQQRWYGLALDDETEVVVTAGATEAIAATLLAFLAPGDEVVTFAPFYDAYDAVAALAGGRLRAVPLEFPAFTPDLDRLRETVTDRTRVIIVNSPHNPTGSVFDLEALGVIVELAERHDAIILSDEVYEHLVFDGVHQPIATVPGAWDRTITVSSAGKTFSVTGWKIGWATGPAHLVSKVYAIKQFLSYANGAPFQPAVAVGLGLPDDHFARQRHSLRERRDLLRSGLTRRGIDFAPAASGYFVIARGELPGVVGIPVSALAHEGYDGLTRYAFCKDRDLIERAVAG